MRKLLSNILYSRSDVESYEDRSLLSKLVLVEEFIGEKFIAVLRLTTVSLFAIGYFVRQDNSYSAALSIIIFILLGVQVFVAIISTIEKIFSRFVIYATLTLDGVSILALFYVYASERSFVTAVNSEVLVYLQVLFIAFQVLRLSQAYIVYAAALLFTGRAAFYLYFKFATEMEVTYEGSALSAVLRYLSLGVLIVIVLYTSARTKAIARKAIHEYLLKNNLLIKNKQLLKLAIVDELTGLYIHRYFQLRLDKEVERAYRRAEPTSLLLIDVDNFKDVNDTFGHQRGDEVLGKVAEIIRTHSRPYDICARYGGDEMSVILPETDQDIALKVAERIRHEVETEFSPREESVSLSIGVATYSPGSAPDPEKLLAAADRAMYKAKKKGRNQVQV